MKSEENEQHIKWLAAGILVSMSPSTRIIGDLFLIAFCEGGTDTTYGVVLSFFLAMVHYPEVQKKAQAEIDTVVGTDRLPMFDDRSRLPYVEALLKEIYRCFVIGPLGVSSFFNPVARFCQRLAQVFLTCLMLTTCMTAILFQRGLSSSQIYGMLRLVIRG